MNSVSSITVYKVFHLLYVMLFVSMAFSLRAVSSIVIGIMLFAGLFLNTAGLKYFARDRHWTLFLFTIILFLLLQFVAFLFTDNLQQSWSNIRVKSGLLLVPLAISATSSYIRSADKLFFHYCLVLAAASLYCLIYNLLSPGTNGILSVLFYHELVAPIGQHAVYFSILVLIAIFYLAEKLLFKPHLRGRNLNLFFLIYFSIFLFLLSSKFAIGFWFLGAIYYSFNFFNVHRVRVVTLSVMLVAGIAVASFTKNPVQSRFADVFKGELSLVTQDQFNQADYFNGFQFRLLQWRFVPEILTQQKAWWLGVSPGDAQSALNDKYAATNMYTGDPGRNDLGYRAYNTHNQYLETTLQNGITGLLLLVLVCYSLVKLVLARRNRLANAVLLTLMAWLFIEATFETQYGVLIFMLFPLLTAKLPTNK